MLLIMVRKVEARFIMIDRPGQAITGGNQRIIGLCFKGIYKDVENQANFFGQIFDGNKYPNDFISGLFSCLGIIDLKRRTFNIQKTSCSTISGI